MTALPNLPRGALGVLNSFLPSVAQIRLALSCRWWLKFYTWHSNWREGIPPAVLPSPPDNLRIHTIRNHRPVVLGFEDILLCLAYPSQLPVVLARNLKTVWPTGVRDEQFARVLAGNVDAPAKSMAIEPYEDGQTQEEKKQADKTLAPVLAERRRQKRRRESSSSSSSSSFSSSASSSSSSSSSPV